MLLFVRCLIQLKRCSAISLSGLIRGIKINIFEITRKKCFTWKYGPVTVALILFAEICALKRMHVNSIEKSYPQVVSANGFSQQFTIINTNWFDIINFNTIYDTVHISLKQFPISLYSDYYKHRYKYGNASLCCFFAFRGFY